MTVPNPMTVLLVAGGFDISRVRLTEIGLRAPEVFDELTQPPSPLTPAWVSQISDFLSKWDETLATVLKMEAGRDELESTPGRAAQAKAEAKLAVITAGEGRFVAESSEVVKLNGLLADREQAMGLLDQAISTARRPALFGKKEFDDRMVELRREQEVQRQELGHLRSRLETASTSARTEWRSLAARRAQIETEINNAKTQVAAEVAAATAMRGEMGDIAGNISTAFLNLLYLALAPIEDSESRGTRELQNFTRGCAASSFPTVFSVESLPSFRACIRSRGAEMYGKLIYLYATMAAAFFPGGETWDMAIPGRSGPVRCSAVISGPLANRFYEESFIPDFGVTTAFYFGGARLFAIHELTGSMRLRSLDGLKATAALAKMGADFANEAGDVDGVSSLVALGDVAWQNISSRISSHEAGYSVWKDINDCARRRSLNFSR